MQRIEHKGWRGWLVVLAVLLGAGGPARAQTPEPPPGGQVITADELAAAGVARLSDLFRLLDDWYATSVDGFAWEASAGALGTLGQSSWLLLVDGQPVDVTFFTGQNVNLLPLSPTMLDYVEVYDAPVFVAGVLAQRGVLHLHTRPARAGATIAGGFAAGNEIGDPGPYRYTPLNSPNIDRIGPTLDGAAAVAGATWHVRAQIKSDEHHATDERIERRVRVRYAGDRPPRLVQASAAVDAGVTSRRLGRHHLLAGFTRLQDLPFFEPLGLEVPTDHYLIHLGLAGDFFPGNPSGISYHLAYTVNDLDLRANPTAIDFNVRQGALRGHYEIRTAVGAVQGALGLSADVFNTVTDEPLTDATLAVPRAYARVGLSGTRRVRPTLTGYLSRADGEAGYGVLASLDVQPDPHHRITLTGSATRRPYVEENSLWLWTRRGYAFLRRTDASVTLPEAFATSSTLTLDAAWRIDATDRLQLTLFGGWRRFQGLTLADYSFALAPDPIDVFDPESAALRAQTTVRTFLEGQATTAGADVRFRLTPTLDQRLHYAYVRYPTEDDTFFEAWRVQPWHRFSYTVRYVPLSRLSLFARLAYRSETLWTAFTPASSASRDGLVQADLQDVWLLDLSAHKRLWKDRLSLSLSLQNFLNEAYRPHPAGAVTNMVFKVRIRASLNGRID